MQAGGRLRHVSGTTWGARRQLGMNRLAKAREAA